MCSCVSRTVEHTIRRLNPFSLGLWMLFRLKPGIKYATVEFRMFSNEKTFHCQVSLQPFSFSRWPLGSKQPQVMLTDGFVSVFERALFHSFFFCL